MKTIKRHKVTIRMKEGKTTFVFTNSKGVRRSVPKGLSEEFKEYLIKNTVASALLPYWEDNIEYEFTININQL